MVRHDPTSEAGWVNWPKSGDRRWHPTGEGGMAVYAVWPDNVANAARVCSAFLMRGRLDADVMTGAHGPAAEDLLDSYTKVMEDSTEYAVGIDQCVLIGSTGGTWYDEELDEPFQCRPENIKPEGLTVLNALAELYGQEATLVTLLDT